MDETGVYYKGSQSVSQSVRKKNTNTVYSCIYMEFRKTVMTILYAMQQKRTDVKNRFLDSVGEGKGNMILENSIEICVLPYVK